MVVLHFRKQHRAWGETPTLYIIQLSGRQAGSKPSSLGSLLTLGEAGSVISSVTGFLPRLLLLNPIEPKRLPLTTLPVSTGDSATASSCHRNIKRGCLCQASFTQASSPPRDECLKQTVLPYARSTGISALGIPRRKHESGWGRCLNKLR